MRDENPKEAILQLPHRFNSQDFEIQEVVASAEMHEKLVEVLYGSQAISFNWVLGISNTKDIFINLTKFHRRDTALQFPDEDLPTQADGKFLASYNDFTYHDIYHLHIINAVYQRVPRYVEEVGKLWEYMDSYLKQIKQEKQDLGGGLRKFHDIILDMEINKIFNNFHHSCPRSFYERSIARWLVISFLFSWPKETKKDILLGKDKEKTRAWLDIIQVGAPSFLTPLSKLTIHGFSYPEEDFIEILIPELRQRLELEEMKT